MRQSSVDSDNAWWILVCAHDHICYEIAAAKILWTLSIQIAREQDFIIPKEHAAYK